MPDNMLEVGAQVDLSDLTSKMEGAAKTVESTTARMRESFDKTGSDSKKSAEEIKATGGDFQSFGQRGIFAFETLQHQMIESLRRLSELRAEMLAATSDAEKMKIAPDLSRAQHEYTALRTQLRGLRMETMEATEKLNLIGSAIGVRIPAELERFIARVPGVQSAMFALFDVAIVVGFVMAIGEAIKRVGEFGEQVMEKAENVRAAWTKMATDIATENNTLDRSLAQTEGRIAGLTGGPMAEFAARLREVQAEHSKLGSEIDRSAASMQKALDIQKPWYESYIRLGGGIAYLSSYLNPFIDHTKAAEEVTKALGDTFVGVGNDATRFATQVNYALATAGVGTGIAMLIQKQHELTLAMEKEPNNEPLQRYFMWVSSQIQLLTKEQENQSAQRQLIEQEEANKRFEMHKSFLEAQINGEKAIGSARIAYQKELTTELAKVGLISIEQETAALRDGEEQKFAIERAAIERRKALLAAEHKATGKDVAPELQTLSDQETALEAQKQTQLAQIDFAGEQKRRQMNDAFNIARASGAKMVADAEISVSEERARRLLATHKITIDEETAQLQAAEKKRYDAEVNQLQAELAIAKSYGELKRAEVERISKELEAQAISHEARMETIVAEGAMKQNALTRKRMLEEVRIADESATKQLSLEENADSRRLRMHDESLRTWETNSLASINRWYETQHVALEKALATARATFGLQSVEYQKMIDKMNLLDQERALKTQKVLDEMLSKYMETYNKITGALNSGITSWVTGHQTFGKAAMQVWQSWMSDAINAILKVVEQHTIKLLYMKVVEALFHTQTQTQAGIAAQSKVAAEISAQTQILTLNNTTMLELNAMQLASTLQYGQNEMTKVAAVTSALATEKAAESTANVARVTSDAAVAAAATLAWYSAINPPIAPEMAAAQYAQTMAYAAPAAFQHGGAVMGPGTSTSDSIPALLSAGEYVVRADVVSKLGVPVLDAINRGFAVGGVIEGGSSHPVAPERPTYAVGGIVERFMHGGTVKFAAGGFAFPSFAIGGIAAPTGGTVISQLPSFGSSRQLGMESSTRGGNTIHGGVNLTYHAGGGRTTPEADARKMFDMIVREFRRRNYSI